MSFHPSRSSYRTPRFNVNFGETFQLSLEVEVVARVTRIQPVLIAQGSRGQVTQQHVPEGIAGVAVIGVPKYASRAEVKAEILVPIMVAGLDVVRSLGEAQIVLDLPIPFRHASFVSRVS